MATAFDRSAKQGILLVDDHAIVREGLSSLIDRTPDLWVCGEAGDIATARALVRRTAPRLVLVDLSLGSDSGIELLKELRVEAPDLLTLVLSMHDELLLAERALKSGARGYVMKQEGAEVLLAAIRQVLSGRIYVSQAVSARLLLSFARHGDQARRLSPIERLTDRELDIFRLIGRGHGTREIAQRLQISVKTVDAHRARMKGKLGLEKAQELVVQAAQWVVDASAKKPR